ARLRNVYIPQTGRRSRAEGWIGKRIVYSAVSGRGRTAVVWATHLRLVPPRSRTRGQNPEGCEASRPPCGAANQVRVGDQPQDRQGARPDGPAVLAAASRPGHRVARCSTNAANS